MLVPMYIQYAEMDRVEFEIGQYVILLAENFHDLLLGSVFALPYRLQHG